MREQSPPALVGRLFDGPLDVIGDVHGELEALEGLLARLGYDARGRHPDGRRVVFVGDLADRGPDSPGVLRLVQALVSDGRAQCVLGNHELNALRGERKKGNGWLFDDDHDRAGGRYEASRAATPSERDEALAFMASLPLALERPGLRVVHACWDEPSVARLRGVTGSVVAHFDAFERAVDASAPRDFDEACERLEALLTREEGFALERLSDRERELAAVMAEHDARRQRDNPVRALTSGYEEVAREVFWASGRWRLTARVPWWERTAPEEPVVVGHYWRKLPGHPLAARAKPDAFPVLPAERFAGPAARVLCVDFSVGERNGHGRAGERALELGHLGAWRSDTGAVVFDR